jgi:uncharacterized membrane protein
MERQWEETKMTKVSYMTKLAALAAIVLIMAFTPAGYLRTPAVEVSFLAIPVAVGAIVLGPAAGAILGGVFGATSFVQCFGSSPFGAALLAINPFFTFISCMIPRILMGWLAGLIFNALHRVDSTKTWSYAVGSLSAAVLNTVLFIGGFVLLFGNSEFVAGLRGGTPILAFAVGMVGVQGAVEAVVCCVAGGAVCKAAQVFSKQGI